MGLDVSDRASVDEVAELAFRDSHRLVLGVAGGAGVVVDLAGARLAPGLCDGHAVQTRIDASVAAAVEAMADRFASVLGGRGREWSGSVEASEAALGESERVPAGHRNK